VSCRAAIQLADKVGIVIEGGVENDQVADDRDENCQSRGQRIADWPESGPHQIVDESHHFRQVDTAVWLIFFSDVSGKVLLGPQEFIQRASQHLLHATILTRTAPVPCGVVFLCHVRLSSILSD
jgi:hypothetical protein